MTPANDDAPGTSRRFTSNDALRVLRAVDRERALAVTLAARAMKAALQQWKCPGCGGSGTYRQNAKDTARKRAAGRAINPQYNPPPVPCRVCKGSGRHPTAEAAIAQADAAGIGRPIADRCKDCPNPPCNAGERDCLEAAALKLST